MKLGVLIIDDSPEDRDAVVTALKKDSRTRYDFSVAPTAKEGLHLLERRQFDLVVLDYRLPDMNAEQFLQILLDGRDVPPVPIVLLTGSFHAEFETSVLNQGVQDFFMKSQISHELLPRIAKNAIERHKLLMKVIASEQKAEEAMLAAESANRAKSQFLASISHELRTPLTAILGFAEILLNDPDADDSRRMLGMIASSGEHLSDLLNDLVDMAKVEAGTLEVDLVNSDVRQVIHHACELMESRAADSCLKLKWRITSALPSCVKVDPVRVRQILINLLGNAIKYTDYGTVECIVDYDAPTQTLNIRVADTGPGIHPEIADRLFTPFTQGPADSEKKRMGIGLGLAISRRLAEMMNGRLTLEKSSDRGSTFLLKLFAPAQTRSSSSASTETDGQLSHDEDDGWNGRRILVVEDVEANRYLLQKVFEKLDIQPQFAHDGLQALEKARNLHEDGSAYDLILMDMNMPVMDGYESTSAIRDLGVESPIVALTAAALTTERDRCLAAGCDEVLVKPLDISKLKACLNRVFQNSADHRD